MKKDKLTRRRFMATSAAASATMVAAPLVHTAGAWATAEVEGFYRN